MTSPPPQSKKAPRPKRLAIAALLVAFFGGSCAIQQATHEVGDPPSREALSKVLREEAGIDKLGQEISEKVVDAARGFAREQVRVGQRFRPFAQGFGFLLAVAYSFVLLFAVRAAGFAPGAARQLSLAALVALPARVAFAAVELASAKELQPALRHLAETWAAGVAGAQADPSQAAHFVNAMGTAATGTALALQGLSAAAVCLVLTWVWSYFQRPEVVALYADPQKTR